MPGSSKPKPASVEDENPATGDGVPGTRKSASGAKSGSKKSSDPSLQKTKASRPSAPPADKSVSGSSHGSRDAGEKEVSRSSRKEDFAPAHIKRRSTMNERDRPREIRPEPRQHSPEKVSRRRESTTKGPEPGPSMPPCGDPNCKGCGVRPSYPYVVTRMTENYPRGSPSQYPPVSLNMQQSYGSVYGPEMNGMSMPGGPPSPAMVSGYATPRETYDAPFPRIPMMPRSAFPISQSMKGSPVRSSPIIRPMTSATIVPDDLDYSTRTHSQAPPPKIPTYDLSQRRKQLEINDFEITTRPGQSGRRDSLRGPQHSPSDTSESSPERPLMRCHRSERGAPPLSRPSLRHSATTSDAVPREMESRHPASYATSTWPVTPHQHDQYDYDANYNKTAIIADNRPRGQSDSRRSETSYQTSISDPTNRKSQREHQQRQQQYLGHHSRRQSMQSQQHDGGGGFDLQHNAALQYQDNVRGYVDRPITVDWLREERRRSLNSGPAYSHVSNGSRHSHRSRNSISSRTSATAAGEKVLVEYKGTILDLPGGQSVRIEQSAYEGGPAKLVIEDGRGKERGYPLEGGSSSVRSSAQASSTENKSQSHRSSRPESETSRGRRMSTRGRQRNEYERE